MSPRHCIGCSSFLVRTVCPLNDYGRLKVPSEGRAERSGSDMDLGNGQNFGDIEKCTTRRTRSHEAGAVALA